MHTIYGFTIPEDHPKHSVCYGQYCNDCHDKKLHEADTHFGGKSNNGDDSSDSEIDGEDLTLVDLHKADTNGDDSSDSEIDGTRKKTTKREATSPSPQKKKKRAKRPDETYRNDPNAE